jgi:hypothetical protein
MRSRQLDAALDELLRATSEHLRAELAAGGEVPFELSTQPSRRGAGAPALYTYRALTGRFIAERDAAIRRLSGYAEASRLLEGYDGLDRYLASAGGEAAAARGRGRTPAAIGVLLDDVFDEQSDFELRPERVKAALERLAQATLASAGDLTLVATLHGVALSSAELQLTSGLRIARATDLPELPDAILAGAETPEAQLVIVFSAHHDDPAEALALGRDVLADLVSALRLFGDGRVALGALGWARVGTGSWGPLALSAGRRPNGMLVITPEQEDELRAFCNLVSRRAPHDNDLAWALRRFELACERESPWEALTDGLLALRALLEPEGPGSGRLAGRLAALCATAEQRAELTERMTRAVALERSLIAGTAAKSSANRALVDDVSNHLRSLLRDVICGHLDPDLAVIADELLEPDELLHADEAGEVGETEAVEAPRTTALDAPAPIFAAVTPASAEFDEELEHVEVEDDLEAAGQQPLPIDGVVSSL